MNHGAAPVLVFTEVVRIGDEAAGDSVLFEDVDGVEVDSQGRMYVQTLQGGGIPVFNADGSFFRQIGQEGGGPGEFEDSPSVYVGQRDTVYAFDSNNNRLTIFSPGDFELVSTVVIDPGAESLQEPWDILATTSDGVLMQYADFISFEGVEEIRLVDWSGRIVRDSLGRLPGEEYVVVESDWGPVELPRLFAREPFYVFGSDHLVYYGWNEDISFKAITPAADLVYEFVVPHEPVQVNSDDREAALEPKSADMRESFRRQMPETKPAYESLVSDDEGRLWVKLSWSEGDLETAWLVLDRATGAVEATVPLSVHADILSIRDNKAYGTIQLEETGEPLVVVWDIGQ